jgi:hypothetical protein
MRNYGRIIQDTIEYACTLTDIAQRHALIVYVAQCMRQKNLVWNRDQESGIERIKADLHTLSNGKLDEDILQLELESKLQNQPQQGQSKKKKK